MECPGGRHNYQPTHNANGTITWTCANCPASFTNGNPKN